ncbi:acyl-CoA dehydrogenase [Sphingomonas sp. SFZ2018-12]|uniref:acyl-CoA dehydrogenase n=1 Tax=Sphingomonas sp. SFZ2018-12 TaxID=2683197 RepID=UPI001F116D0A|nr:acyl-CoA dehydrogenase [Sphingomonas sp. SFZ2018-12]MCH4893256.1 acyl-CoA dehydrogenase [Sphingomonas sp. SFZ2018-12]
MAAQTPTSPISRDDFNFQIFEVLPTLGLSDRPLFADHDRATLDATLDLAERVAVDHFLPGYRKSDANEPYVEDGKVVLVPEIGEAIRAFTEAGFMSAHLPYEEGGQQLPWTVLQSCYAMFQGCNIGATIYYFLTVSAANVLRAHGSQEQKELYMRPMLEGRFHGTMCLSEPHAGSSLADLRTRAIPNGDGTYRIQGTKMWISGGEHELGENIVHLVLARIDGAPAGTRGISLFVVPKRRLNSDGSVGEHNDISLVGLNHKMGYRAATNTVLNFGDNGDCVGYLVGEPHRGLAPMFLMMNEARISVGAGATMLGYAGYRYSLDYARERLQGRPPENKDPAAPPVPLTDHADVRRMLLMQKTFVEGALALCLYAAYLVDEEQTAPEEEARETARRLLAILTPIVKSWPSEFCLEANKQAMQVLGGYGYTLDYPVEQYYRDNRLNLIHEGTNGIQAIDLIGRKLSAEDGAYWSELTGAIRTTLAEARGHAALADHADALDAKLSHAERTVAAVLAATADQPSLRIANATAFQDALGHICIGWMWLRQSIVALNALDETPGAEAKRFYEGKLAATRFFFAYELGRVGPWLEIVERLDRTLLDVDPACL